MNNQHIAVIVEGKKREPEIWNKIQSLFFPATPLFQTKIDTVCLPVGKIIYDVWKRYTDYNAPQGKLKAKMTDKDQIVDIIEVVREVSPEAASALGTLNRDDFLAVYLFFDFDPQQNNIPSQKNSQKFQNPVEIVSDMLATFNNATEQGKLYVSYPMAEALFDIKSDDCKAFGKCCVSVGLKNYKALVSFHSSRLPCEADNKKYGNPVMNVKDSQLATWEMLSAIFLHRCACLFRWANKPPDTERLHQWYKESVQKKDDDKSPQEIFDAEILLKDNCQQIFVLSAFPEFLLDYFGIEEWNAFFECDAMRKRNFDNFQTNPHAASGAAINETRAFQKAVAGVSWSIAAKADTLLGLQPVKQIGFMALQLYRHLSSRESGKTTHSKIMSVESRAVTFSGGAKWKKFTTSVAGLTFTKN